ncbi:MAG: winged helix-turn-helix domain-containing protein [Planctomycetes bacterium]|nr:winged helix-turn-helix domain-containing protein [Planctomycetota bacterium]MBA3707373.1 winged helix-turn-helix domain-containing protein [Planctomycetota bacterium]
MSSTRNPKTAKANKAQTSAKSKSRKSKTHVKPEAKSGPVEGVYAAANSEASSVSKPLSGLDAAAIVLREASGPLNAQDLIGLMLERGLWKTEGKTPAATIYAAMIREIRSKGSASRFRKADRGRFAAVG